MALIKCSDCGSEYSDQAEKCPQCGCPNSNQKKPKSKLKMGCLGAIGLIFLLIVGSCLTNSDNKDSKGNTNSTTQTQQAKEKAKTYVDADINILLGEAKDNAAAAKANYNRKDVKITGGHVQNIDSEVKYISVDGTAAKYTMIHVNCNIDSKNKELKDAVLKLKKGQNVTVYGTITDVGDLMGYRMKLDKIEPAQ